jgi:PAS domain-containing protein
MSVADYPATRILEGLADAVTIIGPDGVHLHANAAAAAILDDLRERHEGRPISDVSWSPDEALARADQGMYEIKRARSARSTAR